MKFLLTAFLLLSATSYAYDRVKIDGKLYIPKGFDDNDLVEITVVGSIPNSCYKNPTFEIEKVNERYTLSLYAYYIPAPEGCKKISMAYTETINFGMMYKGEYVISLVNKKRTEVQKLVVRAATTSLRDEFYYGDVRGVSENDANREVELVGVNPTNCLVFDKLDAEIQDSMIILKPQFKEVGFCQNRPKSFKIKYTVPYLENKPKGILLHVRVMNGRSYNYLYQNRL
jgi:hypothetical protein